MPPNQDSQTTFKPNLTCIFLSARTRYIISIPNGGPCMHTLHTAQIHKLRGLSKVKLIQQGLEILRLKECGPRWYTVFNSLLLSEILPVCVAIYLYAQHTAQIHQLRGLSKVKLISLLIFLGCIGFHFVTIYKLIAIFCDVHCTYTH